MATVEQFVVKVVTQGVEQLKALGSAADQVNNKMSGLASGILGVSFGAFVLGALRSADAVSDLSDATGISIASIKAFGAAMEAAGGNSKNAEKAITTFYASIEAAVDGAGKQQEAFQKVGIGLKELRTLSEAELLQEAIKGLKQLGDGSDAAATKVALFGRSFRSIQGTKIGDLIDSGKYKEAEEAIKAAADANQKMEETFNTLQLGAAKALEPIIKLFGDGKVTIEGATTAVQVLGGALALSFGLKTLASIISIATAIGNTAIATNILNKAILKGPLGKIAGLFVAFETVDAITELDNLKKKNEDLTKSAETAAAKQGIVATDPKAGPAKRNVKAYISPEAQAAEESRKRIAISQAEVTKLTALSADSADQIKNINAERNAEIAKMEIEVNRNKLLNSVQRETEIAQRRVEINKKADLDIAKVRLDVETSLKDQLKTITGANEERAKAFELEQKYARLGSSQLGLQQQLLDIQKRKKDAIDAATKAAEKDPTQGTAAIQQIEENAKKEEAIANQRYEWSRQFSTGWEKAFGEYLDNATNAATQAQAMFQSATNGMNRAIDNFVDNGKFSFSDLTNSIIKDIIKIQLRASVANLVSASSNFLGFRLPGRATGGPVSSGMPYMVGERGPEMFIPAQAGNIMANDKLDSLNGRGGSVNINYNIQAVDAMSFKQMVARDPSFLYAVTEQGRKSIPSTRR
jgi:lambda family phage tail tape measure protein